jgi:hypothetical protein
VRLIITPPGWIIKDVKEGSSLCNFGSINAVLSLKIVVIVVGEKRRACFLIEETLKAAGTEPKPG